MSFSDRMGGIWERMVRPRRNQVESNQAANTALVAGIAALVIGLFYLPFGIVAGLFGVVCGLIGLRRATWMKKGRGQAAAGLVLGAFAVVACAYYLYNAFG